MTTHARWPVVALLGIVLGVGLLLLMPPVTAGAQAAPTVTDTPTPPPSGTPAPPPPAPAPPPSANDIGASVAKALLASLSGDTTGSLTFSAANWIGQRLAAMATTDLGGLNIFTHLEPSLTTENPTVAALRTNLTAVLYALLGVVAIFVGYLLLTAQLSGKEALWIFGPRFLLALVLLKNAGALLSWLVAVVNAASDVLAGGALVNLGAALAAVDGAGGTAAGLLVLAGGTLAAVLFVARLFAHALFDVLDVLAPLALLCWIVPPWSGWFVKWGGLLAAIMGGQLVQVAAMAQGSALLTAAAAKLPGAGGLLLAGGIAVASLFLAVIAPRLVGAGVVQGPGLGRLALRGARAALAAFPGGGIASGAAGAAAGATAAATAAAGQTIAREVWAGPQVIEGTFRPVLPVPRAALPAPAAA